MVNGNLPQIYVLKNYILLDYLEILLLEKQINGKSLIITVEKSVCLLKTLIPLKERSDSI